MMHHGQIDLLLSARLIIQNDLGNPFAKPGQNFPSIFSGLSQRIPIQSQIPQIRQFRQIIDLLELIDQIRAQIQRNQRIQFPQAGQIFDLILREIEIGDVAQLQVPVVDVFDRIVADVQVCEVAEITQVVDIC